MPDLTRFRAGIRRRVEETLTRRSLRTTFRDTDGAIDLASIMVGVLVIGIIAAVIAATVIAVVPWSQDNAAKQDLDAVKTAESVARVQNTKFEDMASLVSTNRIQPKDSVNVATDANGTCYVAVSKSSTGSYFWSSDTQPQARKYVDGDSSDCTDLGVLVGKPVVADMISTWDTSLPGCSTIGLPLSDANATINWGDGTTTTANGAGLASYGNTIMPPLDGTVIPSHTYTDTPGPHVISVTGTFTGYGWGGIDASTMNSCITKVTEWQNTGTTNLESAFADAVNLQSVAEVPAGVTNMNQMFAYDSTFNGDVSGWDVSAVTNMNFMFLGASAFNQDLSGWNVGKVTSHMSFADSLPAASLPKFTS